ncbi:MAG: hypothetical protein ACRDXD_05285 [Acidimicrobiia bacterium]
MARIRARDLATLGVALGGLATLTSGIGLLVSVTRSTPRLMVAAFMLSLSVLAISAATIVLVGMRERRPYDPSGNGDLG